jgi:hypothetical protein
MNETNVYYMKGLIGAEMSVAEIEKRQKFLKDIKREFNLA